ncbi:jg21129 [Pararge aegeria aegeria]|uniref:Jg21129 protein n=1 Tax=Pararge aegeria aegeria TaxID=348720 RepID=A0A8S4QWD2_9NEOP|nr:jg21129 [Pararge aegeria aegeria]
MIRDQLEVEPVTASLLLNACHYPGERSRPPGPVIKPLDIFRDHSEMAKIVADNHLKGVATTSAGDWAERESSP